MRDVTFNVGEFLDRQRFGRFHLLVLALVTAVMCLDGYDTFVVAFTNVPMAKAFAVPPEALTIAIVLQMTGVAVGAYAMGWVADRAGRRLVLLWCTFIFGFLTLLASRAHSIDVFAGIRLLSGLFYGGLYPNAVAIAGEIAPRRYRATMVGIVIAGYTLGPAVAAASSALIIPAFGWQGAYVAGGAATLVLLPVLYLVLPESIRFRVHEDRRDRRIGALLRRIDDTLLLTGNEEYILSEVGEQQRPRISELFKHGRAATTLFVWMSVFLVGAVLPLLGTWIPTFLTTLGGLSVQRSGALNGIFATSGLVALPIAGFLVDRWSTPARAATLLTVLSGIGIASLGLVDVNSPALYLALFLSGVGLLGSISSLTAVATYLYPTRIRGVGVGWSVGATRIGGIAGPAAGGAMLGAHWSLTAIFLAASSGAFLSALITIGIWLAPRGDEAAETLSPVPGAGR
jgi:MFS transporter, AAHS family, 4-hydroxybenzoate transporter